MIGTGDHPDRRSWGELIIPMLWSCLSGCPESKTSVKLRIPAYEFEMDTSLLS
jgi:hypothetical protein